VRNLACRFVLFAQIFRDSDDAADNEAGVSHDGGAERGVGSLRGRRRAPRRFGGWQGRRRPAGTRNRLVRVDATDILAVIVLVRTVHKKLDQTD